MFIAGLVLIVAGWAVQVYRTAVRKERDVSLLFPILYWLGCVLLFVGNFMANDIVTGILNTICAILAAIVFIALLAGKRAT